MPKIKVIVGLPGSGKSTHGARLSKEYSGIWEEDFMANSIGDAKSFRKSCHYQELKNNLMEGKDCIIADVDFCRTNRRDEFENVIREDFPEIKIEWLFLENDARECVRRVVKRNRDSWREEVETILKLEKNYEIPAEAEVYPLSGDHKDLPQCLN